MINQLWTQLDYIFSTFLLNKLPPLKPLSHFSPGDPSSQVLFCNQTSLTTPADQSTLGLTSLLKGCESLTSLSDVTFSLQNFTGPISSPCLVLSVLSHSDI